MIESVQFEIILEILKRFQTAGVLDKLVLIGSWCMYFYRLISRPFARIMLIPSFGGADN